MSPSWNPMRTLSNLMAGLESGGDVTGLFIGGVPAIIATILAPRGNETKRFCRARRRGEGGLEKFVGEEQGYLGEESIGHDDHDGRQDRRLRRGAADALRAAAHRQAFVTADGRENEGEKKGLHKTLHQVRKIQSIDGAPPKLDHTES